jgi:hypothetical protein
MKVVKLSQLRVGQRFSFIPSDWFGPARLSDKIRRDEYDVRYNPFRMVRRVKYDIKFDANVVNPPGVIYRSHASHRKDTTPAMSSNKEKYPALLHGSTGVVGPENNSWASKAAAAWLQKEAERKATDDLDLWLARLEREHA